MQLIINCMLITISVHINILKHEAVCVEVYSTENIGKL